MQNWKMALGTMALGAVAISPFIAEVALAGAAKKTAKGEKPPEPTAAEVETGQLLDKGPRWPNKARQAGEPTGPTEPTAAEVETGQKLIKDKPVAKSGTNPADAAAAANDLCGVPYTPPCRSDASTVKKAADKVKPN